HSGTLGTLARCQRGPIGARVPVVPTVLVPKGTNGGHMRPALLLAIGLLTISRPALAQDAPQVYKPGDGVTAPRLLREVKPFYSPEAMRAGTTGRAKLECVVRPDGTVTEIRVTESLSPVLDEEATR